MRALFRSVSPLSALFFSLCLPQVSIATDTLSNSSSATATSKISQSEINSVVSIWDQNPQHEAVWVNGQEVLPRQIVPVGTQWQATLVSPSNSSVEKLLLEVRKHPHVVHAERNYPAQVNLTPNDPSYTESTQNTTHFGQINSEEAWDTRTDCSSVVIAVVDTGADIDHPDLFGNLWQNPNETADNGIDDDNNGYIDDVNGACVRNDCAGGDVDDGFGHGSHVAGLIAAEGNNGVGATGVCWDAQLMIVKSLGDTGSGTTSDVAAGINYAVNNGADIINASLTISSYSNAIKSAIEQAEQAGILVVTAAGNFGSNNDTTPVYPANFRNDHDNVMTIANVNVTNQLHSSSNYGARSVDMAAPGVDLFSTWKDGMYANSTGTSMSAPLVTATAALMLSEQTVSDRHLKASLMEHAQASSNLDWQMVVPSVLNANTALSNVSTTPLTLFRASADSGNYQLFGYDLSNVDTVTFTELLTSGNQDTNITSFTDQNANSLTFPLPDNAKSGVFTLHQGQTESNPLFVKRTISAPSNVAFIRDGSSLTLSWNNPSNADVIRIERATPGSAYREIALLDAPNSVYQDTIETTQQYYYRIRGSYDYVSPITNLSTTEYSSFSTTLITSSDDETNGNYWLTNALPNIALNSDVAIQLSSTVPGNYRLISGTLPTGLSINTQGVLSGTANDVGDYMFSIGFQASGGSSLQTQHFSMSIIDATAGTMQLTDQQSLTINVAASSGTLSSIQSLKPENFDSLNAQSVQLIQKIQITNLPVTAAETSEISLTLVNASSGRFNDIYLQNQTNQWLSSSSITNAEVSSSSVSIVIEDGSSLDLDRSINGEILAHVASVSQNNTTASGGSDSRCFIASSVYPSGHHNLTTLRNFRDDILASLPGGNEIIGLYYENSPKLIVWMQQYPALIEVTKHALNTASFIIRTPIEIFIALALLLLAWRKWVHSKA
jgi:subtilisin family serine protease